MGGFVARSSGDAHQWDRPVLALVDRLPPAADRAAEDAGADRARSAQGPGDRRSPGGDHGAPGGDHGAPGWLTRLVHRLTRTDPDLANDPALSASRQQVIELDQLRRDLRDLRDEVAVLRTGNFAEDAIRAAVRHREGP